MFSNLSCNIPQSCVKVKFSVCFPQRNGKISVEISTELWYTMKDMFVDVAEHL